MSDGLPNLERSPRRSRVVQESGLSGPVSGTTGTAQEPSAAPTLEDVKRLRLDPGDTLVVRLAAPWTDQNRQELADRLKLAFPDNQVLVTDPGVELTVMSPEESS